MRYTEIELLRAGHAGLLVENERLRAEVVEWKKAAGKYSAGCELCAPTEDDNERLRTAARNAIEAIQDDNDDIAAVAYLKTALAGNDEQSEGGIDV